MRFKFYNKEYDSENIDYIKLAIEYNNSSKLYYFVVSENGNENIILESKTIDELEILDKYNNLENIKNELGFINAKNEFSVFINPYKAKQLEVKENLFKRKYLVAKYGLDWDEDKIFKTKTLAHNDFRWENLLEKILNYKKNLNNKLEEKLSTKECPLLKAMHKKELDFIMKLDLDSCEIIKVKQSEIYNQEDDSEIEK